MYQFNLTIEKVLTSDVDTEIQVEGIIEDIDIHTPKEIRAIQCKYHEAQDNFKLSLIYKPVLQMLKTYAQNPDLDVKYILHGYFPNLTDENTNLTMDDLNSMLTTTNIDYISNYVSFICPPDDQNISDLVKKERKSAEDKKTIKEYYVKSLPTPCCNIKTFLHSKFEFHSGDSYEVLEQRVQELLVCDSISEDDVKDLFYPNAVQKVAEISMNPNDAERMLTKDWLIKDLSCKKKTAITRWTKEVTNYKSLLRVRQRQLSSNLNNNTQKRCFVIDSDLLDNFNNGIVLFLKEYVELYCHKPKLHNPTLFHFINSDKSVVDDIVARLYSKGIEVETGYRGSTFFEEALMRNPERKINDNWIEFKIRLTHDDAIVPKVLSENKPDDLFIICKKIPSNIDTQDINCEFLDVTVFNELKYLLKMTKEI